MFFWKQGRRWIFILIILIIITSLIVAQIGSIYRPAENFLLLPTRIWELAIGALIAINALRTIQR